MFHFFWLGTLGLVSLYRKIRILEKKSGLKSVDGDFKLTAMLP